MKTEIIQKACIQLMPSAQAMLDCRIPLPRVVNVIAIHCFIHNLQEPDVDVIRQALQELEEGRHWSE